MFRRQSRGFPLALAAALLVLWPAVVHAEAEPVEHYESLPELVATADAIVVGTAVAIEEGPQIGPNGWLEGVWAKVVVENVIWAREPVPAEIVLDGLGLRDVPPVGQSSALVLRREKESPAPHYRLVVPGSMLLLPPAGSAPGEGAPAYMSELTGLHFVEVVERLRALTPQPVQEPPFKGEGALPYLALILGTIVAGGTLFLYARSRAHRRTHA